MAGDRSKCRKTAGRKPLRSARRWQTREVGDNADFDEDLSEWASAAGLTLEEIEGTPRDPAPKTAG